MRDRPCKKGDRPLKIEVCPNIINLSKKRKIVYNTNMGGKQIIRLRECKKYQESEEIKELARGDKKMCLFEIGN